MAPTPSRMQRLMDCPVGDVTLGQRLGRLAKGLAAFALTELTQGLLAKTAMASSLAQAALAEWLAVYAGILWTQPQPLGEPAAPTLPPLNRALRGAALGFAGGFLALGFAVMVGGASFETATPSLALLGTGLLTSACLAVKMDLLVVGLVNRVLDQVVPSRAVCILCGLAFAAVAFGEDLGPWEILHQGLLGTALGAAWAWDRGAWFPWGAHTAFRWLFSSVFRGGVYEVRSLEGPWGDGKHSPEHSLAILGPMAVFALVALAAAHRSKGLSPANESP